MNFSEPDASTVNLNIFAMFDSDFLRNITIAF